MLLKMGDDKTSKKDIVRIILLIKRNFTVSQIKNCFDL